MQSMRHKCAINFMVGIFDNNYLVGLCHAVQLCLNSEPLSQCFLHTSFRLYFLECFFKDLKKAKNRKSQEKAKVATNISNQVISSVQHKVRINLDIPLKLEKEELSKQHYFGK